MVKKDLGGDHHVDPSYEASNIPLAGNYVEVPQETFPPGESQELTMGDFYPSKFNNDEVDNIIQDLESATNVGLKTKVSRYKSLSRTLRKSLGFACTTNQNLMKLVDANEMKNVHENPATGGSQPAVHSEYVGLIGNISIFHMPVIDAKPGGNTVYTSRLLAALSRVLVNRKTMKYEQSVGGDHHVDPSYDYSVPEWI